MNQSRFGLFSLVFLASAVLGLATARSLSSFLEIPAAPGSSVLDSAQKNIVIIHVDDLDAKAPQLISVWSVFSIANEETYITMTPLYPATVPDPAASMLASSFDLNGRKKPVKDFLKALQAYQVVWDGYIVVDQQGMKDMYQWLAGNHNVNLIGQGSNDPVLILQEESLLLTGICYGLNQTGPAPDESAQWEALSDHLKTDLSIRRIIPYWRQMNRSQSPHVCNILSN
jgi:hypothetical protein